MTRKPDLRGGSERALAPACQSDPEQWFDAAARTTCLRHCLACPYRRRCAQLALQYRPSGGMWAGIWIPDRAFSRAAADLERVAAQPPTIRPCPPPPAAQPPDTQHLPTGVTVRPNAPTSARAIVLARSTGHCEIMSSGCSLAADTIQRRTGTEHSCDAATSFAACRRCAQLIADMDPQIAQRLGYRITDARAATSIPFFWRQSHRLIFDSSGGLHPVPVRTNTGTE